MMAADFKIKKRPRLCLKLSDRRKSPPPPKERIIAKNNHPEVLPIYKSVIKTNSSPTSKIKTPPTKNEMVLKGANIHKYNYAFFLNADAIITLEIQEWIELFNKIKFAFKLISNIFLKKPTSFVLVL